MNNFSNLSDVCVLAVSFHPGLTQIKASSGLTGTDTRHAPRCSPSLPCKLVFASHLCLSACSWSALSCSRCSWAWVACRLSLLCSTCSCSSTLMLRSCTLCALVFACSVFSCWILDSSLGKKRRGEERLLINFNSTTQQYSSTDLFLFAQGVFQILLPNFQHLLELPSLFLLYAFLNFTMNCSNDVKMIISGPGQNLWK